MVNAVTRLGPYGDKMRIQSIEWLTMYPIQHGAAVRVAMHCHATADCDGVAAAIGHARAELRELVHLLSAPAEQPPRRRSRLTAISAVSGALFPS